MLFATFKEKPRLQRQNAIRTIFEFRIKIIVDYSRLVGLIRFGSDNHNENFGKLSQIGWEQSTIIIRTNLVFFRALRNDCHIAVA